MNKKELEYIKKFHGHIGKWVLIGYVIGKLTKKTFKEKLVKIKIDTPLKPPISCLIDGIQLGSGLTIGRGEVIIRKSRNIKISILAQNKSIMIKLAQNFIKNLEEHKKLNDKKLAEYIGNTFIKFF